MTSIKHISGIILILAAVICSSIYGNAQTQSKRRRMTPVETPATMTKSINETLTDSTRIIEARKARSTHFHDEQGRIVYVDTVTGEQWIDSTALIPVIKMKYPLWESAAAGIDVWDPLMRAFGQSYGLAGAWVELSLHNRYKPVFEFGLGAAKHTPSDNNYTYRSPLSTYFKIGLNYNFLYNSSPDYQFYGGVRYGFSPFKYSIDDITISGSYWGEEAKFAIPSQSATVGWFELVFGLRVKLWGPISAGWAFKYHTILHESKNKYGNPWYIPGYGSRSGAVTGSFSISYTFSFDKLNKDKSDDVIDPIESSAATIPQEDTTAE